MRNSKTPGFPLPVGLDKADPAPGRHPRPNDGYPPFNIERFFAIGSGENDRLRITLAVAGFDEGELDVSVEGEQLVVRGRQAARVEPEFLFRGIAARQFQRVFLLEKGMDVLCASLRNGLLSIDLIRPQSAQVVRKINISAAQ
ncbi:Hsp20 family protein [Ciceribacter naphthalenivorans]|uniref:Heat-shock protein Hsp20 n=3 Tax=Alphaproteobacteria TaxID=28211 RepID=A0A512HDU3_9HYPH|nr:Hsp20 family protein [Ciceribacter naphthalenivorans]GEO83624.1 heat-shock protein Hsp20 [Ciceribacter naphthalenivorans]GLR24224.1 heat-shock protein Hsp20 [Ciceribacter naphthalenivorans]GLT07080.1 heat-shock protein Hsp20 [Sphingomonas psychrolutea]